MECGTAETKKCATVIVQSFPTYILYKSELNLLSCTKNLWRQVKIIFRRSVV